MLSLVFSPGAASDIESIWDFTEGRWGTDQAERYVMALRDTCAAMADGSRPGQDASDIRDGYQKLRCGKHVIFARGRDDGALEIVRILHERMDITAHLGVDHP